MKPHVVIGGGIGGLIAAWALRERWPDAPVIVLEQAPCLGGLLAGTHYPADNLYFDQGTHIFQETGNATIDTFIRGAIPPEALVLLPQRAGDLAGAAFGGRLQANSHFPDLRAHPLRTALGGALRRHAAGPSFSPEIARAEPLLAAARRRFGDDYTTSVLSPMLAGMYRIEPHELAAFALLLPGLTRVIATDAEEWRARAGEPAWRAIFGFPEQRELPDAFRHGRRSFTSRTEGSCGVIRAVADELAQRDVRLFTSSTIKALDPARLTIDYVDAAQRPHTLPAESVFIATGAIGAARLLGLPIDDLGLVPPMLHRVVNVVLDEPADSDLHYFYGLDPEQTFYRVTHYRGFSGDPEDRRLSIEVLERAEFPDDRLPDLLLSELHALGFLRTTGRRFAHVERVPKGFPRPTVANLAGMGKLQRRLRDRLPPGIHVGGVGVDDAAFFTNEILVAIHRTISGAPVS